MLAAPVSAVCRRGAKKKGRVPQKTAAEDLPVNMKKDGFYTILWDLFLFFFAFPGAAAERSFLFQIIFQLSAAAGMAQFPQGFGFDLADTLPGDAEFLSHFLQGSGAAVVKAETEL